MGRAHCAPEVDLPKQLGTYVFWSQLIIVPLKCGHHTNQDVSKVSAVAKFQVVLSLVVFISRRQGRGRGGMSGMGGVGFTRVDVRIAEGEDTVEHAQRV